MPKLRQLKKYHKEAMELKYRGRSYKDIAEKLTERFSKKIKRNFSEQTIKDWFKQDGTLCENYHKYETEIDEIERENLVIVKRMGTKIREENFRIANEMLIALMGSANDSIKLAAVKEILDRVEGKPTAKAGDDDEPRGMLYERVIRELEQEAEEYKKERGEN